MKTKLLMMTLAIGFWMGSNQVQAAPIAIQVTGVVTYKNGSGLPGTIREGVSFIGTYTYNSDTSDSDTLPQWGIYQHNSPYGISISLGGYEFKTSSDHVNKFEMQIGNDVPGNGIKDFYTVYSDDNVFISSTGTTIDWIGWIRWDLWDTVHATLSSDVLPATVPILTDWDHNVLEIYGYGFGNLSIIKGTVTQAVLIPEPLTGVLMVIGMFLLRRKQ